MTDNRVLSTLVDSHISGKNKLLNGDFAISQRGTSITGIATDNTYTADRWYIERGGTYSYNQRTVGSFNPPPGFRNYAEYTCTGASSAFFALAQIIESTNCYALQGQIVTFSGYIRAGANTTGSKTFYISIQPSNSADTRANKYVQASAVVTANSGTSASDWTRFSLTTTIPSAALSVMAYVASGAQVQNDSFQVTGLQLELGSTATPFALATGNAASELAACQRYYFRNTGSGSNALVTDCGISYSATKSNVIIKYPVTMRTTPTAVDFSSLNITDLVNYNYSISGLTIDSINSNPSMALLDCTHGSGTTANRSAWARGSIANAYLGLSAEL